MNISSVGMSQQYSPLVQSQASQTRASSTVASAAEEQSESPQQRAQENESVGGTINTTA